MTRYSRTSKYEDLRNRLQNDNEDDLSTPSLSAFERRLNSINADNFKKPVEYNNEEHDPIHARRREAMEIPAVNAATEETDGLSMEAAFPRSDHFGSSFRNEYLDEYIKEVKKYNLDQGNAFSTNTNLNILQSIQDTKTVVPPLRPYSNEDTKTTAEVPSLAGLQQQIDSVNHQIMPEKEETADIPFFSSDRNKSYPASYEDDVYTPQSMTKEDIAAEVQNLIREQDTSDGNLSFDSDTEQSLNYHFAEERTARQKLLNETTQMRAQLDDYEDNLSAVNEKMNKTNQALNIILIVLIIALFVALAVVIYWILSLKGIGR